MPSRKAASSSPILSSLSRALQSRAARSLLRTLPPGPGARHDFSSNDYLGVSRHPLFRQLAARQAERYHRLNGYARPRASSTGSRLLSGNMPCLGELERAAARFHRAEDALVLPNGYMACLALIGCVAAGAADVFVVDELVHASCWDGGKMSRAGGWFTFRHGDVEHMEEVIEERLRCGGKGGGNVFVVVESLYSMGGRGGRVGEVLERCEVVRERWPGRDVMVIVDEAHACGIFGGRGEGKVVELGLEDHPRLLARVITFGKAFGCYGSFVVGSALLKQYLLNYARPVIYSTAVPVAQAATMRAVYDFMDTEEAASLRRKLKVNVELLKQAAKNMLMESEDGPIQAVLVKGNRRCVEVGNLLGDKGFGVSAIRSPTVPKGEERIRVTVHAFNTKEEIVALVSSLRDIITQSASLRRCRL